MHLSYALDLYAHSLMTYIQAGGNFWSVQELFHAVLIMVHFHALAGFVFGCGVNPDVDMEDGHIWGTA